jgi:WD repeat-containing protein 45
LKFQFSKNILFLIGLETPSNHFLTQKKMSLNLTTLDNFETNGDVIFLGFNQDHSCLAAGSKDGFRVYSCVPYKETIKRSIFYFFKIKIAFSGGIGIVEMLFRCNILALVGGGEDPAFQKNKVILWDDNQSTQIGELTFKSDVKAVKLRREKFVFFFKNISQNCGCS